MAELTKTEAVKLGVPPAFRDRYVIRCTDKKFGPNSKGNPMVTLNWEVVGYPNNTGSVDTEITRNGQAYQIAGLRVQPSWFTLVAGKALQSWIEFYEAANGPGSFTSVDPENPNIEFTEGLVMEAVLYTQEQVQRKELTDEEKADKRAKNEPLLGDPIKDGDGKEVKSQQISIQSFLKKFTGDLGNVPY